MAKKKSKLKPAAKPKGGKKTETLSFEAAMRDLESIVAELEQGNLSLDDSLEKYEAGVTRLRECHSVLKSAEAKIKKLVRVDDEGNASLVDFEESGEDQVEAEDFSDEDPNEEQGGQLF